MSNEPPEINPVVVIVDEPVSIVPKPDVIEPEFRAPTVVRLDVTTAPPSVVAFSTSVPLILYVLPVPDVSMSTLDCQAVVA